MTSHDGRLTTGTVEWFLHDEAGALLASGESHNLITQVGDQMQGERAAGITTLAAPTGMKLGTGSTAVAKTGAGAALVTYLTNSHQGFDATYPQSALNGAARRITYQCTFAAGKATSASTPITEAVLVNAALTDATSTGANTIARVLLNPAVTAKTATDILTVIWQHDNQGI